MSINDVAVFKRDNPNDYVKGYEINWELRHNFLNKEFKISPGKSKTYIDEIMRQSAKIPGPDKYTGARENFNDVKKNSKILAFDRKTHMDFIIKAAKQTPGVGRYDSSNYDEKYEKPPKFGKAGKETKYNFVDESAYLGKISPKQHD